MVSRRQITITSAATTPPSIPPLNTFKPLRRTKPNRVFSVIYAFAILTLLYHQALNLLFYPSATSTFFLSLLLFIANIIFAFQWASTQSFRMCPIRRNQYTGTLEEKTNSSSDCPMVDIFICTADPFKEPPIVVVNTALSLMAYDYPAEKISVYVSDDGGSELTLFALMEAAKFAAHWLPFCKRNNVVDRCPDAFFDAGNFSRSSDTDNIKMMYESMILRVEHVVERGKTGEEYIHEEKEREAFRKWTGDFTRQNHPTVIEVLCDSGKEKDIDGNLMPNLIYVSREKSQSHHHHFKAGALNTLIRVSGAMTNAPIVLTQDCDTYSNDPETIKRVLCYFLDPAILPSLAYVQFPQIFRGLNKDDIYGSEHKRLYQINPLGMDGFSGPNYVGPNCFFNRRAFFGSPSSKMEEDFVARKEPYVQCCSSSEVLTLAYRVAACDYESSSGHHLWGSKIGMRYGTLSEDIFTGYRMQCEGWKAIFCHPAERPAFLGDAPVTLIDSLGQLKRWSVGLLQVLFCKYCPLMYGTRHVGIFMALAYAHNAFWPIWFVPLTIYAFVPQLALLNGLSVFPKVGDPLFLVHISLFVGAYGQDLFEFMLAKGTFKRWWNCQRMWMICGLSSFLFGFLEFTLKSLGIPMQGFNVTSKVQDDDELAKRYEQGIFEFGVVSPMFVPITMAAIINLIVLFFALFLVLTIVIAGTGAGEEGMIQGLVLQMLLAGFVVINSWPVYQAMVLRTDKGRMPPKVTIVSLCTTLLLVSLVANLL